jgi:hypothetical protein
MAIWKIQKAASEASYHQNKNIKEGNMDLKQQMIAAATKHAEAELELHKTNIEVYMQKVVGIGEHSDIIETIQKELDAMAAAHDRLEMLNTYFV